MDRIAQHRRGRGQSIPFERFIRVNPIEITVNLYAHFKAGALGEEVGFGQKLGFDSELIIRD